MTPRWLTLAGFYCVLMMVLGSALVGADKVASSGGLFFGRPPDPQKCRRYYVAAEPVLWDYLPSGKDEMCGGQLPTPLLENRKVGKLRYVQYTDATFTAKVIENPSLGILGPVLRGVVGEFLVVTFLNRTGRPVSMHPHGVRYDKDSEGASYSPPSGKGASVEPGASFTYVWQLDASSGPLPGEPSSKGWLYHSHVDAEEEINQGLIGFIVVTDPARARPDGTPADVDREFGALFLIFDESGLAAEAKEANEYVNNGSGIPTKSWAEIQQLLEDGARTAINGRLFGNLPGLEMNEGERVRWYLFGLGSEQDFHTAHWHGQRLIEDGRRRTDVVELLPASMKVADQVADNPGTWLFQCHVADHMREGMFARIVVHPRESDRGADRAAEAAFLGFASSSSSLRIQRAVALLDPELKPASCNIHLRGTVTVFDAFSVFTQQVRLQLGGKSVVFKPDRTGASKTEGGAFEIKNAGRSGVIHGGLMEFEAVLSGAEWAAELKNTGLLESEQTKGLPLVIEVGTARHSTEVQLARRTVRP
ncbi:MAG TPA: multicopper oxidase domain-containing protein [Opitutaceae bacterium]|nr:multicopper oxidase domain-containing protein [Opitutaceae bacterium]